MRLRAPASTFAAASKTLDLETELGPSINVTEEPGGMARWPSRLSVVGSGNAAPKRLSARPEGIVSRVFLEPEGLTELLEALAGPLGTGLLGFWAWGHVGLSRSVASLKPLWRGGSSPVSVVVAARDEEERLPALLEALTQLGEPLVEVIVVDDGSRDATPRIVEEYAFRDHRFRLIRSPGTPKGWAPKSYALWLGASAARGEVLFFLDADTRLLDPAAALEAAASTPGGTVGVFVPRFLCRGFWCRAAEAFLTAVAHAFYGFHRVQDPGDPLAWMYGCCWSIRRMDYLRLEGHRAVAGSIVEDRDFAVHAKRAGLRLVAMDARRAVGVESYEGLRGYAGLAARLAAERAWRAGRLRWALEVAALALVLYGSAAAAAVSWPLSAPGAAALAAQLLLYARGSKVNMQSPLYAAPGYLAQAASLYGAAAARSGYTWRGRRYSRGRAVNAS